MNAPEHLWDRTDGKIWGVCSRIAHRTGIDALWVRLAFVAGAIASIGTAALIYIGIALIVD